MIVYNTINFQKLSWLEKYYDDPINGIPKSSGIYFWVHYPEFDAATITDSALISLLENYSSKSLNHIEEMKGTYKFAAEIREQGFPDSGELFGLSPSKSKNLKAFLAVGQPNKASFKTFFQELCFARPFYVGKANNLRDRLANKHFKRYNSKVLDDIEDQKINFSDVWIGYKLIPQLSTGEELNVIFEEILSRTLKPGLTKKPN